MRIRLMARSSTTISEKPAGDVTLEISTTINGCETILQQR